MPEIQISCNNRAKCRKCYQKILKGTSRVGTGTGYRLHQFSKWYHIECYPKAVGIKFPALSLAFRGYNLLPKKEKRAFRKAVWPNQVSDKRKPQIKLLKEFNEMTVKDLKFELERRDLSRSGNKPKLKDRLEEYLNQEQCRKVNKLLVVGYCKQNEKKYCLNMPVYLKQIVNAYFPLCA